MCLAKPLLYLLILGLSRSKNPRVSFMGGPSIGISWQHDCLSSCGLTNFGSSTSLETDVDNCSILHFGRDKNLGIQVVSRKQCDLYQGDAFYRITLDSLEYQTKYYYRTNCDDTIYSFVTAQEPGVVESFTFAVYADMGTIHAESTLARLHGHREELVGHIFAGDIGYADDAFTNAESYLTRTNRFLEALAPSSAYIPVMVAPGNHEAEDHTPLCLTSPLCRSGYGNFTAFNCIWNMPETKGHSMWSSFDYGPVHFVLTNTETDYAGAPLEPFGEIGFIPTGKFGLPGEYTEWLRNDLQTAASNEYIRWIVVVGHRPITVLDETLDDYKTPLNQEIIALINTYADVYVAGHVHYYTRSVPRPPSALPVYITVGGAGCDEWDERTVKTTISGSTTVFDYYAFGNEQTYSLLKFSKDKPNEIVFEVYGSVGGQLVDRVVVPVRTRKSANTVVLTQ